MSCETTRPENYLATNLRDSIPGKPTILGDRTAITAEPCALLSQRNSLIRTKLADWLILFGLLTAPALGGELCLQRRRLGGAGPSGRRLALGATVGAVRFQEPAKSDDAVRNAPPTGRPPSELAHCKARRHGVG
jgi:hypothetical protein